MKKIRVGIDFDGVLAYNPFRIIRAPVTWFKQKILGEKKTHFYIPKTAWEKFIWKILHESSIFPAKGGELLKEMAEREDIEFYLVTSRYHFLQNKLYQWLKRWGFTKVFSEIYSNQKDEQPHLFKERMIRELKLDYFVEDNWDVVKNLQNASKTKVFWISNIFDYGRDYKYKFPYLEKALEKILFSSVNLEKIK